MRKTVWSPKPHLNKIKIYYKINIMKFEEWWKKEIEDNPLWKMSNNNLNWKDVRIISKIAYIQGMHEEFENQLKKKL